MVFGLKKKEEQGSIVNLQCSRSSIRYCEKDMCVHLTGLIKLSMKGERNWKVDTQNFSVARTTMLIDLRDVFFILFTLLNCSNTPKNQLIFESLEDDYLHHPSCLSDHWQETIQSINLSKKTICCDRMLSKYLWYLNTNLLKEIQNLPAL